MRMQRIVILISLVFILPIFLFATDYSGSTFIVRDPVISAGGSRSTSTNFELYSSLTTAGTTSSTATERIAFFISASCSSEK